MPEYFGCRKSRFCWQHEMQSTIYAILIFANHLGFDFENNEENYKSN